MQPSNELKGVLEAIYKAMSKGSAEDFAKIQSRQEGVLVIGTDASEWRRGYEDIIAQFRQQFTEMKDSIKFEGSDIKAFTEGSVGWADDNLILTLPDNTRIPMRISCVFHMEEDGWKMVQWHGSVGTASEEVTGKELIV